MTLAFSKSRAGRHPVVEAARRRPFSTAQGSCANDCDLGTEGNRLWLVTGPNMAGKSDLPAPERPDRHPGADRRLRARRQAATMSASSTGCSAGSAPADDLARGRSTFMVEMVETAAILNQATARARW